MLQAAGGNLQKKFGGQVKRAAGRVCRRSISGAIGVRNHQLQFDLGRIAMFAIERTGCEKYRHGENELSRTGGRLMAG